MELRNFFRILWREKVIIILCLIATIASGMFFLSEEEKNYDTNISILVSYRSVDNSDAENFEYNNYYGTLTAQFFNESISSLLKNVGTVESVFKQAGTSFLEESVTNPSKFFKTTRKSQHISEVRFTNENSQSAQYLATALGEILQTKATDFSQTSGEGTLYLDISSPTIDENIPPTELYIVILTVLGAIVSVMIIMTKVYFKDEVTSSSEVSQMLEIPLLATVSKDHFHKDEHFYQIRDQVISLLLAGEGSEVYVVGNDKKLSKSLAKQLSSKLVVKEQSAQFIDISKYSLSEARKEIKKHKNHLKVNLLAPFFDPHQHVELLVEADILLIILPLNNLSRDYLDSVKKVLATSTKQQCLVLYS